MLVFVLVGLGLVLIIAIMAFVINPPEAWIKKIFHGSKESNAGRESPNDRHSGEQ